MSIKNRQIRKHTAPGGVSRAEQPVIITIARDFGAEGHEIGKMLSDELGIPLYDNELLTRASLRHGESLDYMAAYDEQLALENIAFLPDRIDARSVGDKLFESMSQLILDLGSSESCIIEGRLSDYLLRNNPNHIAVLVTAPLDARIEIVRKKRGLSKRAGAKLVKEQQRAREQFYKRYSAGKWRMDMGKDIVVNRAKLGRQGCVDVIATAYYAKLREVGLPIPPVPVAEVQAQEELDPLDAQDLQHDMTDVDMNDVNGGLGTDTSEVDEQGIGTSDIDELNLQEALDSDEQNLEALDSDNQDLQSTQDLQDASDVDVQDPQGVSDVDDFDSPAVSDADTQELQDTSSADTQDLQDSADKQDMNEK